MRFNKYSLVALAICILVNACAPPPPPAFVGDYRPVNRSKKTIGPPIFDFNYEGDVANALEALRAICPQLEILPPVGKASPLAVKLLLRETTLENALHALGEEVKNSADIVLAPSKDHESTEVFLLFKNVNKPSPKSKKRGTK